MPGAGKLRSIVVDTFTKTRLTSDDTIECTWVMVQAPNGAVDEIFVGDALISAYSAKKGIIPPIGGQFAPTLIPGPIKLYDIYAQSNAFVNLMVNYLENPD